MLLYGNLYHVPKKQEITIFLLYFLGKEKKICHFFRFLIYSVPRIICFVQIEHLVAYAFAPSMNRPSAATLGGEEVNLILRIIPINQRHAKMVELSG